MGHSHTRPRVLVAGIIAGLVMLLVGIWLGGHPGDLPSPLRGGLFESRRPEPVTEQALDILTTRYYRPLDRSSLVDVGLSDIVASLDDPYSRYVDPSSYRASMDESEQHTTGIGIEVMSEPQGLRVINVYENSPAAEAGLMDGDLITKVGSTSLANKAEDFGSNLIRGPAGTSVTLTVMRGRVERVVSIDRAKIVVPVAMARMVSYDSLRIGYLRLTGFTEGSGDELRTETQTVLRAGALALILDLRGNGGGLISEAINVASIFIPRGTIMSAVERGRPRRVYDADGDAIAAHIPLVVLVDHGTASSAEIVTAALQDHGRAEIVGTNTYGKGVFQITEPLNNGGALDLTIGQFFTPDGRNLGGGGARQGAGITPNIYAPSDARTPGDEALTIAERTVAAEVH
ncbi:MAG TPA: S41 family peptidase [Solirubrobacteraceae bacterium]|nr:S41 family peptidase [Solirubrobacteraceae bacterium]